MKRETEYTDSNGVLYVAANPLDCKNQCSGCAHEDDDRLDGGCSTAPSCARIIWVKAEDGSIA